MYAHIHHSIIPIQTHHVHLVCWKKTAKDIISLIDWTWKRKSIHIVSWNMANIMDIYMEHIWTRFGILLKKVRWYFGFQWNDHHPLGDWLTNFHFFFFILGKMCVLDCSPNALKLLYNSTEFMPYVIFIAAPGMEQLKQLYAERRATGGSQRNLAVNLIIYCVKKRFLFFSFLDVVCLTDDCWCNMCLLIFDLISLQTCLMFSLTPNTLSSLPFSTPYCPSIWSDWNSFRLLHIFLFRFFFLFLF